MTETALDTVRLRDEKGALEAMFVPSAGMLCCSLRHRGDELLAQNAGVAAYAELGKTMGIPLLYPWANRLAGFEYTVGGRTVAVPRDLSRVRVDGKGLPIHGVIGGLLEWELAGAYDPMGAQSLVARLSWSEERAELFEVFPFRHDLQYEARLAGGQMEIWVTVHACGGDAVPVAFGFHPYLSLPDIPRERWLVGLPAMRHLALDASQIPVGSLGSSSPYSASSLRSASSMTASTRWQTQSASRLPAAAVASRSNSWRATRARRSSRPALGSSSVSSRWRRPPMPCGPARVCVSLCQVRAIARGSPSALGSRQLWECQVFDRTEMPAASASVAWLVSSVCRTRPVAAAVAMISRSVALVVRPAERAVASTSP